MQAEQPKQIKSVKQISDQIRQAKRQFQLVLNNLAIPNITLEEDLTKRTPTIQTILRDLPSENRLKQMMDHPYAQTPEIRQRILSGYKGKYDFIRRAAQNIHNLKCEAEKIYYLAAELNLYKIKSEFDPEQIDTVTLKNAEIYKNQNLRLPRYEKNMLNPAYLKDLREQQLLSGSVPTEYLPVGEPIITVCLYDSINGEKTFEYNCYGDQSLLDLACKFYCMIAKLQGKENNHWNNSYFLIQENFYYQGNISRKKIEEIITFSSQHIVEEDEPITQPVHSLFEMSKFKLKNLRVVYGRPYLFRHLEGCDHIIIFKDMHVLAEGQCYEPALRSKYPLTAFEGRMRKKKCDGCRSRYADRVSLNDPLKSGKHLYLCKECHENLHPDERQETCIRYLHD